MPKSFYDLDYIIEINEKRIEQYLSAYQKVLERLTNIILIYSAITIFLTSIIKIVFINKHCPTFLYPCFGAFVLLFAVSLYFTVRLIIPVDIYYLTAPRKYYEDFRLVYEEIIQNQTEVEKLLKASYIDELEKILGNYQQVFRRKSSFYYNALMYALLSAVPYIICIGFHISKKEENIQKVEIVNSEKISNLLKIDSMSKENKNTTNSTVNTKTSITGTRTKLPGIDNTQVIPSSPDIIKENSHKVKKK
jgi:hypothetical protein